MHALNRGGTEVVAVLETREGETEVAKDKVKTESIERLSEVQAAGFKTTTVRLPGDLFEEMEIYVSALRINLTEFIKNAVEHEIASVGADPAVAKAAQRQLSHFIKMAQRIKDRAESNGDGS